MECILRAKITFNNRKQIMKYEHENRFRQNRRPSFMQRIVNGLYNSKNRLVHNFSVQHAWFILGVIFVIYGAFNLFFYGFFGSILSIAGGGLIVYSSIHNFGGWFYTKQAMKRLFFR